MRGRGGQFKRNNQSRRPSDNAGPAFKKRKSNASAAIQVENEEPTIDTSQIVDSGPSYYQQLLSILPSTYSNEDIKNDRSIKTLKPTKIVIAKKEKKQEKSDHVEEDDDPVDRKKPKKLDQEKTSVEEEKGEENEEIEEENENFDEMKTHLKEESQQIGFDYAREHYSTKLTKEHVEILNQQSNWTYSSKNLGQISEFYKMHEFGELYYAEAAANFVLDSNKPHVPLPKITVVEENEEKKKKNKIQPEKYAEFLQQVFLKRKLRTTFEYAIKKHIKEHLKTRKTLLSINEEYKRHKVPSTDDMFASFCSVFPLMNEYYDFFHSCYSELHNAPIRAAYMLHIANHCLKMKEIEIKNTHKMNFLQKQEQEKKAEMKMTEKTYWKGVLGDKGRKKKNQKNPRALQDALDLLDRDIASLQEKQATLSEKNQDQGFTRPRVLIMVPTQEIAGKLIELLIWTLSGDEESRAFKTMNKTRFYEYFLPPDRDLAPHPQKPLDFNSLFHGNTNDSFYITMKVAANNLHLYVDLYACDVIIGSPVGIRAMIDRSEGTRGCFDFLSSIEMVVVDLMDVFLMQNWEHVDYIFKHLNQVPELPRDTDFSRVKPYFLEGWAKYYRQNMFFSRFITPEIQGLFNRHCFNFKGKVRLQQVQEGVVSQVISQAPQRFEKIGCKAITDADQTRFDYFTQEIFAQLRSRTQQNHTLIFIPSYFDFVRVRNFFKQERISFLSINEYTSGAKIARSRLAFFKGETEYLLVTERFYFFRRYKINGVKNLVFYGPPLNAKFYQEFVNLVDANEGSSLLLYVTPFDQLALQRIVGSKRCKKMLASPTNSHLIVAGNKTQ